MLRMATVLPCLRSTAAMMLTATLAMTLAESARAAPIEVSMEPQALTEEGWRLRNPFSPSPPLQQGAALVLPARFDSVYQLVNDEAAWRRFAHADRGWWVEAELRRSLTDGCNPRFGPGFDVFDGSEDVSVRVHPGRVLVVQGNDVQAVIIDTSGVRRYRLVNDGGLLTLLVDDVPLASLERRLVPSRANPSLQFGAFGGCSETPTPFYGLRYETAPPGLGDADDDEDGIVASLDTCPDVHDLEQVDTDRDGFGDLCDGCPDERLVHEPFEGSCEDVFCRMAEARGSVCFAPGAGVVSSSVVGSGSGVSGSGAGGAGIIVTAADDDVDEGGCGQLRAAASTPMAFAVLVLLGLKRRRRLRLVR